ncbi:acyltransferase family protein [Microbacterium sp. ARD32]|uniref:acyltransferase family protein n=1 Tax=Microbacterium sp. ARD32 TaxID=2962577 RepID=UPI0028810C51|nr:acyltransferase family protein [Microbacterium sp. ARD32]MDT0156343.1 acyltransferase family protein [Microbacterium sp. ARD32]
MDAVRGTAIVLLLIWHASAVPELYGVDMPSGIRTVNEFFMPYRMPTLMLLSGILLARSLEKPLAKYYAGKFSMILWPYLVWVIIAKMTFLDIEGMPWWHWRAWYATSYLWFLFFIGVYYLIAPAFARLPSWLPAALAVIIGVMLPAGTMEQRMAYFAVFFFGGYWLAKFPDKLAAIINSRLVFLAGIPVAALGLASCFWPEQLHFAVWTAPASVAGMLLLAALFSRLTSRGRGAPALQAFGRSSLIYYVSHFPLMALLSMSALAQLGAVPLAVLNLLAALGLGWFLAWNKQRAPIRWLFEAPRTVTRALERSLNALFRQRVA